MIPHSHFGMSGPIQRHTLVYTVVMASALAVFFDLGQIASLGAFFYLIMDMMVHWGSLPLSTQGNRGVSGIAADGAFVRRCGAGCFHRDEARQRSSDPAIQRSSDCCLCLDRYSRSFWIRAVVPVALGCSCRRLI
ncbi:MAG: hypothetical protein ACI8WM_002224 [Burkholderiaceae bacterium]|jgi:hypothetical protein